jgi:UDP-N-acetyl-D-mannosaminuronic acid dehydrogenase
MMPGRENLKVCVMGLGYIGLPTSAMLASRGVNVLGVDIKPEVVQTVNKGQIHIVEPDLDMLVRAATQMKKLQASGQPRESDVFIIAVPTPLHPSSEGIPRPCVDYVLEAARALAPFVRAGNLVIIESTSPVGTTEEVAGVLAQAGVDVAAIHLAYCPERVLPGKVLTELIENDRVVGGYTPEAAAHAREFYSIFVRGKIYETHCRVAEMVKLTENSYRDVNIAFANELSLICDKLGIDVGELIRLASCHPRVKILSPGCGVGGHCIAVDPWFIVHSDPENARLIRTAREVNDYKTLWVIERIKAAYRKLGKVRPVVAICGLAFKPNIDDLRASPALGVARALAHESDAEFLYVEPNIASHPEFTLTPWKEALGQADLLVRLVAHAEFAEDMKIQKRVPLLDFAAH